MHNELVAKYLDLPENAIAFLETIEEQMSIVADLSRADILLYARKSEDELFVFAHAQPHSLAHVYSRARTGRIVSNSHRPEIYRVLTTGRPVENQRSFIAEGAPVVRQTFPIHYPPLMPPMLDVHVNGSTPSGEKSQIIAAMIIVTNLIEYERHRFRSPVFKQGLKNLQRMLLAGQLPGASDLSPFGEQDGIIIADTSGIIRYISGIATNLYRRVGYREALIGRPLSALETEDEPLWRETLAQRRCLERETPEEEERYWVRKSIPLINYPSPYSFWLKPLNFLKRPKIDGVLIMLHDDTDTRRQDQEMRIKNALIQEVHHRVKNNLQTIAGLLRMQIRRVDSEEARQVLEEALSRILSVAVIHEFLSSDSSNVINIKEVGNRIISQLQYGMLSADAKIKLELTGESIYLPARQATSCSLIINELVQNAIEHGFEQTKEGIIRVNLEDSGDEVMISVADNGDGLPGGFHLEDTESLGLQIVRILVEGDLKGRIQLGGGIDNGSGLSVKIIFPKTLFRGEAGWKEHVSL